MTSSANSQTHLPRHLIEVSDAAGRDAVLGLARAVPFGFISPPGAANALGAPWWHQLMEGIALPHFLDCDDDASMAAWALRHGQPVVIFSGEGLQAASLHALADIVGGTILRQRPGAFTLGAVPLTEYHRRKLTAYLASESV